jgi:hypothetical protein
MVNDDDLQRQEFDRILDKVGSELISKFSSRKLRIPISKTVDIRDLSTGDFEFKVLIPDKSYLLENGYDATFIIGKAKYEDEFNFYSVFDLGDIGTLNPVYLGGHMDHKVHFNRDGVTSIEVDAMNIGAITTTMGIEAILSRPYLEETNLVESSTVIARPGQLHLGSAIGEHELGIIAYHPRLKFAFGDVIKLASFIDPLGELAIAKFMSEVYKTLPNHSKEVGYMADLVNPDIQKRTLGGFRKIYGYTPFSYIDETSEAILASKDHFKTKQFHELRFVLYGLVTGCNVRNDDIFAEYALDFLNEEYGLNRQAGVIVNGVQCDVLNKFMGISTRLNPRTGTLFTSGINSRNQQVQLGSYKVLR